MLCVGCNVVQLNLMCVCVVQSQQARLATLYLPLFGLLQANVHRLNVREMCPSQVCNPSRWCALIAA